MSIGQLWAASGQDQVPLRVEIRIPEGNGKTHPVRAGHGAGPKSYKGDFIFLMLGKHRVCFSEHVEGARNIERLHTIEHDNGDFHAVTFLEWVSPFPIPAI